VQYNTSSGLVSEIFQPFKLTLSRDRVTEEESKVVILDTTDALLNYPNKIREEDFEGWIQEYGLYFPVPGDFNYISLFSMNDTGETPNKNSTVYCRFGKGKYVYTGLSFFRELPAGVPGATKLFVNLIEDNIEQKEILRIPNEMDSGDKSSSKDLLPDRKQRKKKTKK